MFIWRTTAPETPVLSTYRHSDLFEFLEPMGSRLTIDLLQSFFRLDARIAERLLHHRSQSRSGGFGGGTHARQDRCGPRAIGILVVAQDFDEDGHGRFHVASVKGS